VNRLKSIYVIVATSEWGEDMLRYRRHRLAEFLQNQKHTEEVIWLCPASLSKKGDLEKLSNDILQWPIADAGESKLFRFSRFLPVFYKKKMKPLLTYLFEKHSEYKINLWYTYPAYGNLAKMFPWNKIIYDCSDLWSQPINGTASILASARQKLIYSSEEKIIQKADYIACSSPYLYDQIAERAPEKKQAIYMYENGVEYDLFQTREKAKELLPAYAQGPVFGYIGGIKPKLDFALIREVAKQKADWFFLFVGPDSTNQCEDFQQLLKERNVLWIGGVPSHLVPIYMNSIDIGIMPYKSSSYNKAIFPLKLFEFLAAGKGVVGVNLPSTAQYREEGVYSCLKGEDSQLFIQECEKFVDKINNDSFSERRMMLAKKKDWNTIFSTMVGQIVK